MGAESIIKVGVVGVRVGGRTHIPALQALPEYEVTAVCAAHDTTVASAGQRYGIPNVFTDYKKMLGTADLDMVVVATPVPLHYSVVKAAIEAGKHVVCEWPLGSNSSEAQEMLALAVEKRVIHAVVLEGRFSPALMMMKELITEGFIGRPLSFDLTNLIPAYARPPVRDRLWFADADHGASSLTIETGHATDVLLWCLGNISSLCADVQTLIGEWHMPDTGEVVPVTAPDNVAFLANVEGGIVGTVHASRVATEGSGGRFEVFGTDGRLLAWTSGHPIQKPGRLRTFKLKLDDRYTGFRDSQANQLVSSPRDEKELDEGSEMEILSRLKLVTELDSTAWMYHEAQFYRHMATAIAESREMDPSFSDAVRLHSLLDTIVESSQARSWVSVV